MNLKIKDEIANIAAHVPNIYSNLIFDRIRFKVLYKPSRTLHDGNDLQILDPFTAKHGEMTTLRLTMTP